LPDAAQVERRLSLKAVAESRRRRISLERAAVEVGTSIEAIQWYAPEAVYREGGRLRVRPADRVLRDLHVPSNGQLVSIDVRGSRKASEVSDYYNAVYRYLEYNEPEHLQRFEGKTVAGVPYETDTAVLEEMWRRGDLSVEDIYRLVDT
jgi:hypothetical protein